MADGPADAQRLGFGGDLVPLEELDLEKTSEDDFALEIIRKSKGKNYEIAENNARNISYNFKTDGNSLVLDPYFFILFK